MPTPLNYSVVNPPHFSSVHQQSSSSSQNTTPESQASSIPGWTSPDLSNTMPSPSTNNGGRNIYGCVVYVYKFTTSQQKHHAIISLKHYHELCNMNYPSYMFLSPPYIPNIELLSQSTISSLDSGSFGRKRYHGNIQQ